MIYLADTRRLLSILGRLRADASARLGQPSGCIRFTEYIPSLTAFMLFLQTWSAESLQLFMFVSGVLLPAVSVLFGWALPIIMCKLMKYMGVYTHRLLYSPIVCIMSPY